MDKKYFWIIKLLDEGGNWYVNAMIENSFDAMQVARFYRDQLGYFVQLWHEEEDKTALLDSVKFVEIKK